jgi:hypothetical protein
MCIQVCLARGSERLPRANRGGGEFLSACDELGHRILSAVSLSALSMSFSNASIEDQRPTL